jgi:ribose 1,5-bisphosphate isomerase
MQKEKKNVKKITKKSKINKINSNKFNSKKIENKKKNNKKDNNKCIKKNINKKVSKNKVKQWSKKDTNKIINNIKSLKIQGATNVAKSALEVLHNEFLLNNEIANINEIFNRLIKTRPTEPMMRNSLKYYFHLIKKEKKTPNEAYQIINNYFDYAQRKIAFFGSELIKNGKAYFTHCHSSDVMSVFKKARETKLFRVFNTETRPLFQGRTTAKELSESGIPVIHGVDSGARVFLKNSEAMLIGCDAITDKAEVYNKIGSEMFAEVARSQRKKVYVCTNSWKIDPYTFFGFDEKIEQRNEVEVWKEYPVGVIINNFAFEKVNPKKITAIISEFGVLSPSQFIKTAKKRNSWMFE